MKKRYGLESAVSRVKRGGVSVNSLEKTIDFKDGQGAGIGTWGAIDYLCRKHSYAVRRDGRFVSTMIKH